VQQKPAGLVRSLMLITPITQHHYMPEPLCFYLFMPQQDTHHLAHLVATIQCTKLLRTMTMTMMTVVVVVGVVVVVVDDGDCC
jgi:hypothetical protein